MKSLKLHYLILLFGQLALFGQTEDAIVTAKILNLEDVIPVPNKGFILFKTDSIESPTVLDFSYFNLNHEQVSTISIPTSRTNEFFAIEKIFIWNNNLIICSSLYQPGFRKNHLLYYEYSLPNLTLTKSEILLKTIAPQNVYVPYFVNLSPDSSKLITLGWDYSKPKEKAKIQTKVFNKDLVIEKQDDYKFDYENQRIALEAVLIDDNSNIYITGNNYRGYLDEPIFPFKIEHFVLGLFPNKENKFWPIKKEKQYFPEIKYTLNKEQTLIGSGIWVKGYKSGIGLINISRDSQIANIVTHQIDNKIFKAAYQRNLPTLKIPKVAFYGYDLTHIICKEDAYFIIGENHKYDDQYDGILVVKLTKKGELTWLSRIPKSQNIQDIPDRFASFKLLERKDKLVFLYNDNYLNYENEKNALIRTTSINNAKPALAELSLSNGYFERKLLNNLLKKDFFFLPVFCQNITEEEIIIIGTGRLTNANKFSLKKVKIKA